jgi:Spy/CpxP family protein refolding chaperone
MKKLMLVCCFVIGATAMSFAQGGGRQQRSPEEQAKALQAQLKLTDDQTAKVTAIYVTQAAKRDSMMKAGADRSAMRPLMQASNEKIQALLTDEQKEAYKKMMAERMSRMGGGQGGGGGTPPPPPSK